jgi:hypothetical protein
MSYFTTVPYSRIKKFFYIFVTPSITFMGPTQFKILLKKGTKPFGDKGF